jgi:hypothetical protein
VGENREPSVAVHSQPILETTFDQLCALNGSILRTRIGIAAEFVVEDTRAEMHLPANVDAGKTIHEFSTAVAQGRRK